MAIGYFERLAKRGQTRQFKVPVKSFTSLELTDVPFEVRSLISIVIYTETCDLLLKFECRILGMGVWELRKTLS